MRTASADLTGIAVTGRLDTASGESWQREVAVVGPDVEFNRRDAASRVTVTLNLDGEGMTFLVVNDAPGNDLNPDGLMRLDVRGFILGHLDAAGSIAAVTLASSSFPTGTFDRLSFTSSSIAWIAPDLVMPGKGTIWRARWTVTTSR